MINANELIKDILMLEPKKLDDKNYIAVTEINEVINRHTELNIVQVRVEQQKILDNSNINIVTCGECGQYMIVYRNRQETHTCPFCDFTADPSCFPDLFH